MLLLNTAPYELYEFGAQLGAGAGGTVYKAVRRCDNYVVAIKERLVSDHASVALAAANEIAVLRALWEDCTEYPPHPAIIHFINHHYTELLVLEYFADGRTLFEFIEDNKSHTIQHTSIARQLLGALAYLHDDKNAGYAHCDVKLENILINAAQEIRLVDFGSARSAAYVPHPDCTWGGTVTYHAPELLPPVGYTHHSSSLAKKQTTIWRHAPLAFFLRTDVWAAGIVLYEVATRCAFFDGRLENVGPYTGAQLERLHDLPEPVSSSAYEWPQQVELAHVPDDAVRAVIAACCTPDPAARPSAAAVLALL